jgi:four helix bundle suffix protein
MGNQDFLPQRGNYRDLIAFQKAECIYDVTYYFAHHFYQRGDRTIDQMVQAARSGKQNIAEGCTDSTMSREMELKLLNVAMGSLKELLEDYQDFLTSRHLALWRAGHPRYDAMLEFCRKHNRLEDYEPFFNVWSDEEMANTALTLCHMVGTMMTNYLGQLEEQFVKVGGIKERMHAARTGYRRAEDEELARLRQEVPALRSEITRLRQLLAQHGIDYGQERE